MKSYRRWATLWIVLSSGCAATAEPGAIDQGLPGASPGAAGAPATAPETEAQAILDIMRGYGFDATEIEVDGPFVRVRGDEVFDRASVLDGAYDWMFAPTGDALVEKGYRSSGKASKPSDIRLDVYSVPNGWLQAVDNAAWGWNSASNYAVNMGRGKSGSGGHVDIVTVSLANWAFTGCKSADQACITRWPNGTILTTVWVKSQFNELCPYTLSSLTAVLLHEFGHVLGLTHPGQGTHISGTADCKLVDGKCFAGSPGYDTVMKSGIIIPWPSCELTDFDDLYPYPDDVKSIRKLYPR